jgi:DNA-binding transcriptional MerR regulator
VGGRNVSVVSDRPPARLLSIGEFADVCQLSVKMLRHYHAIGLLEPACVDPASGYRYYRFDQSAAALAIAELRTLDVPLADIAAVLAAGDPASRAAVLGAHRDRLRLQLRRTEERLAHIERLLLEEEPNVSYDVVEEDIPAQRVASKRVSGPNSPESNQAALVAGLTDVWDAIVAAGGGEEDVTGPPVVVVHFGDEDRFEQELCIPVRRVTPSGDGIGVRELEPVRGAVARHHGERPDVRAVMAWANERGHRVGTPFRVVLVSAPPYFGEGDEHVSDIVVPYLDEAATPSA